MGTSHRPGRRHRRAWLQTGESYAFTAAASIRAVEETLTRSLPGAFSPAAAFGADFALTIPAPPGPTPSPPKPRPAVRWNEVTRPHAANGDGRMSTPANHTTHASHSSSVPRRGASAQHLLAEMTGRLSCLETSMDNAARTRQRVVALFLPVAAVLYISAEALSPKGTDQVATDTATALKLLAIAAKHPAQLYAAGTLRGSGLEALPSRMRRSPRWPEAAVRPWPPSRR